MSPVKIEPSNREGKKFKVTVKGETIHFGARGMRIYPGTSRGDNYCARSYGITDKDGNPTRNNPMSANHWSRKKWRCSGKVSMR